MRASQARQAGSTPVYRLFGRYVPFHGVFRAFRKKEKVLYFKRIIRKSVGIVRDYA